MNESINRFRPNGELEKPEQVRLEKSNLPSISRGSYSYESDEKASHLLDYWRIIRKRLWLIIGVAVLIPTLTSIIVIRKPDIYEAQARIQVDLENANPLLNGMSKNSSVVLGGENNDPAYFNTQLQILTGPGLLRRVAKNLDLEHNSTFLRDYPRSNSMLPDFRRMLGLKTNIAQNSPVSDSLPVLSSDSVGTTALELAEAERLSDYVDDLQETLKVEPVKESRLTVRETRLIDINYRHTDPRLAAKIVNTIAQTFVDQNLEKKKSTSGSTGTYLEKRIAELQSTIRAKEEELINYGNSHKIISLDKNENTVVERLAGLNKQLLDAENERKIAQAAYEASQQPGAAEALSQGGQSEKEVSTATRLRTEAELKLNDLRQKRAELSVENTDKWPAMKEIDRQIVVLEKQISDTRNRAITTISANLVTRFKQAQATEDALRKAYNEQRTETLTQNEAAVNYHIIQQEIDTNKSLLDSLLQQMKTNDVILTGTPNNIRVVDFAIAQKKPVSPKRTFIVAMAVLLSLGCGVAMAFFLEYLDDTIKSSEDIENFLHLPSVALIPMASQPKQKRSLVLASKNSLAAGNGGNGPQQVLLTQLDKHSPVAEAYRHLRTSILLSTAGRPPRSLLITSSVPSEGKTTTAVNTALSLVQTGARVLIIDADMRRPRLHSIFNLSNNEGLSGLLSREVGDAEINASIQKDHESGLHVLTSGPVPPNPAELLGSEQMLKLVASVTSNFAHVIIDSPPVAAFTDGVLIGAMVDGVLLVVNSGKSSRRVVSRARRLLQDVGARIIGVVLNKIEAAGSNSYYYRGYYQHYHADDPADSQSLGA
jgi:polysaccharide biosynthesis transport protein